ncbi:MAG: Gfo/Idh/MocA family oxidoreductase [Caldilineaceae bacterium]|nr:Gfo/Idh/MocA family oxidoreductase [Caldilineaceae bacterium]
MLNVAIIGMGNIGRTHAGVYQASERAHLAAVCDMDKSIADAAAERFAVPAYYSVSELLDNVELNAVSVTTAGPENGGHHYEPVMQCFDAGLHVLCEKPISNNIEHAREMAARADETGLYFGINLNHRFVPPAARARQWVEEGRLGDLLLMNMTMWIGNPNDTSPWFHIRALHPHSLDIMRYFTNPRHNLERCEVMGTAGRFVLDNLYQELTLYPRQSEELTVVRNSIMGGLSGFDATFTNRINRWIEQVDEGVPRDEIEASGREGLAVQEIIEAAIRSHHSGKAEEVPAV